jgi:cardiolipin synthase A/B
MFIDIFLVSQASLWGWVTLIIFFLCMDIVAILHILKNKHDQPASAILWIFLVIELHIAGIILYLILGINRLNTKGLKVGKIHKSTRAMRNTPGTLSKYLEKMIQFNYSGNLKDEHKYLSVLDRILPSTYPVCGNNLELLEDGTTAYPKMFNAIRNAKNHIHLQSYIIMNDDTGDKLFNILKEKAKTGVKVKVLFDRMGSGKAYKAHFFKHWTKGLPNFEIKPFSKVNLLAPYRIQLRNHRKLLIVDGKTAFIGGVNISSENDQHINKNKYIHDLHSKITGPVVGEFQYIFLRDWSLVTKISPLEIFEVNNYFPSPIKCGNSLVRVNSSGPGQTYEASKKLFMTAVTTAQHSLWIVTPYFVPDKSFIDMLCMAAGRNVEIKIVIPQNNNHWYVHYAARSIYNTLLKANIRIFEKKGVFSHVKAMMVDGIWATMGSSNCDNRSFRLNYELDFVVQGGDFIRDLHDQILKEIEESEEITLEKRKKRTPKEELLENFCSLLTPVL